MPNSPHENPQNDPQNASDLTPSEAPFDPLAAAAALRAESHMRGGPRLTLTTQCEAFALLKSGVAQEVVARMFALSRSSVSHLANCLNRTAGRTWRYPAVFIEWRRLGEAEFLKAYLTEDNYLKAKRLALDVPEPLDDQSAIYAVSNPRADGCSHAKMGEFEVAHMRVRIDWAECTQADIEPDKRGPIGWRWTEIAAPYAYQSIPPWDEEPARADGIWMPWRTSGDAFDYVFKIMGLKSPRRGRPRKDQTPY